MKRPTIIEDLKKVSREDLPAAIAEMSTPVQLELAKWCIWMYLASDLEGKDREDAIDGAILGAAMINVDLLEISKRK